MPSDMRITVEDVRSMKGRMPVTALTAYTYPVATQVNRYADVVLVGDSLGMVLYGMPSTVPVTLEMMVNHGRAVANACDRALTVIDMPFGSYQASPEQAFTSAAHLLKETGCQAVKLEGGAEMTETVSFLVQRGIPVCGHVGLMPQSINHTGRYRQRGKTESERRMILSDAVDIARAGAFAVVLECVDAETARDVTGAVDIPVIGIGTSCSCDGNILVTEDLLGLTLSTPGFVKKYEQLSERAELALKRYAHDAKTGAGTNKQAKVANR